MKIGKHWKVKNTGRKPVWCLLSILLCALMLASCTLRPDETGHGIKVLSRDSLGSCQKVLEAVQNGENYKITTFRGTPQVNLGNYSSRSNYWKAGSDWMQINITENANSESVFAYLYRDGIYYDNVATVGVENGHILWNASSDRNIRKPWLASFHWDEKKVQLLERRKDEDGTHILLQITDTLTDGAAVAEAYTVEFNFSTNKAFSNAVINADMQEPNGMIREMETAMFASLFLERSTIESEMETAFQSKLPPLASSIEGQTGTYGALSMTLPEGYFWKHGSGTGLLLYKNGVLAGGVTHWNTPGEDEDWINSLGLWDAMSGASYMVSFWDSQNMVTASFTNESNREAMDNSHTFYIRGTVCYDLWFNSNLISREEASQLRKTVAISDEAPELEEKSIHSSEIPLLDLTAIPQGYRCEEREDGNLAILEGDFIIGGIDTYPIPGGAMTTYDPYFRWLESLGIPDYVDDTLCYMGGGSLYGNWEMHFESDVPPGVERTVDRYHTFFVGQTKVWDVWFDLMITDRTTMDMLLSDLSGKESCMETVPANAVTFTDLYTSNDGTAEFVILTGMLDREELEAENGISLEQIMEKAREEFLTTSVNSFGFDPEAMGHKGEHTTVEIYITDLRKSGGYLIAADTPVPTVELWGKRYYHFENGETMGAEQDAFAIMTVNALNGDILSRFGRK